MGTDECRQNFCCLFPDTTGALMTCPKQSIQRHHEYNLQSFCPPPPPPQWRKPQGSIWSKISKLVSIKYYSNHRITKLEEVVNKAACWLAATAVTYSSWVPGCLHNSKCKHVLSGRTTALSNSLSTTVMRSCSRSSLNSPSKKSRRNTSER